MANQIPVKAALVGLCSAMSAALLNGEEVVRSRYTMGTLLRVAVSARSAGEAEAAATAALDEVDRWDRLLSTYRADSEISRVNRSSPESAGVSPEAVQAVSAALGWARETGGAFDPTVGPLIHLWGFDGSPGQVPSPDEIQRALPLVGYGQAQVTASTIRLAKKGMALDFGAIGKGWALDRALEKAMAGGIDEVVMDFGGQILFWSNEPKDWPAAVRRTEEPSALRAADSPRSSAERADGSPGVGPLFPVKGNGSLSTSAAAERFLLAADPKSGTPEKRVARRYGHILDPRTGEPAEPCESVTVWAPTATEADVLSTAIFVLGPVEGKDFAERKHVAMSMLYKNKEEGIREIHSSYWTFGPVK